MGGRGPRLCRGDLFRILGVSPSTLFGRGIQKNTMKRVVANSRYRSYRPSDLAMQIRTLRALMEVVRESRSIGEVPAALLTNADSFALAVNELPSKEREQVVKELWRTFDELGLASVVTKALLRGTLKRSLTPEAVQAVVMAAMEGSKLRDARTQAAAHLRVAAAEVQVAAAQMQVARRNVVHGPHRVLQAVQSQQQKLANAHKRIATVSLLMTVLLQLQTQSTASAHPSWVQLFTPPYLL